MFESYDFRAFFEGLLEKKILIVGDVMVDTYLWGKVDRVSPEAPVPIVSDIIEESRLGGAANVALNIKAMGAVPILCSVIGGDEQGTVFLDMLSEQNLADVGITVDEYRITTQKTRVISDQKHLLRIDEEITNPLSQRVQKEFSEMIENLLRTGNIDAVVVQDYDKGVVTPSLVESLVFLAKELNIPILVDPKFRNFSHFKSLTLLKPNYKEFVKGLNIETGKDEVEKLIELGKDFRASAKIDFLMLTLSDKGIIMISDEIAEHIPAEKRKVTDVSGAGDTVISLAALALVSGMNAQQLALVSNIAGGLVCEKSGVVPVSKEDLLMECEKQFASRADHPKP